MPLMARPWQPRAQLPLPGPFTKVPVSTPLDKLEDGGSDDSEDEPISIV